MVAGCLLLLVVPSGGARLVVTVPPPGAMWVLSTGPRLLRLGEVFGSGSVDDWLANPIGPVAFTGGTVALQ